MSKTRKYTWVIIDFDSWMKKQAENMRQNGMQMGTAGVSKMLMERVIIPNNLDLSKIFETKPLRIKKLKKRIY